MIRHRAGMEAMIATVGEAAGGGGVHRSGLAHTSARSTRKTNVNRVERAAPALLGATLLTRGLTRPSPAGGAMIFLGGGLLYRAISGHCYLYRVLGISTAKSGAERRHLERADVHSR